MAGAMLLALPVGWNTVAWAGDARAMTTGKALDRPSRTYLHDVLRETFDSITYLVHPQTGLPYDSSHRPRHTSITNLGLYLAAVAVGQRMGLVEREDALARISSALDSLERIQRWHGFPVSWVDVETLATIEGEQFSTADHLGNLIASLLVVRQAVPEVADRITAYLQPMEWGYLYDEETGWLKGGYNVYAGDFTIDQPWGKWYYAFLGADTRTYSFLAIGSGHVPIRHWQILLRDTEERYGFHYLVPGWQGGGLFMQYLPGIFIRERKTEAGRSARQFALAQMEHGRRLTLPVWGWSACVSPTGEYLGWGRITDAVVTPHASALAALDDPRQALSNFRALEALGARRPLLLDGAGRVWIPGFCGCDQRTAGGPGVAARSRHDLPGAGQRGPSRHRLEAVPARCDGAVGLDASSKNRNPYRGVQRTGTVTPTGYRARFPGIQQTEDRS